MNSERIMQNPYIVETGAGWLSKLLLGKQKAQIADCNTRMKKIMRAMCPGGENWDVKEWWGELDDLEHQIYKLHEEKYGCLIPLDDKKARQTNVYCWLKEGIKIIAKERKQTEDEVAKMIKIMSGGLLQAWEKKRPDVEFKYFWDDGEPNDDIPEILYDMYNCSLTYK